MRLNSRDITMSSAHETPNIITVLGATGNQGGGVVQALLKITAPSFHVRAITRDVSSNSAENSEHGSRTTTA